LKPRRDAKVLVNKVLAGILSEYTEGENKWVSFKYEEGYLANGSPIGSRFPLTSAPFCWDELPPFFENLASEGWLRKIQCEQSGVDMDDTFGLLLANGKELIGALSITPHKQND
jgi:serine/threonine-protein kinase HipA